MARPEVEKIAIIQGEFHLSSKDAHELAERDLDDWDAILVEGREPVYSLDSARFGFWYYAIGAMFTRTFVGLIHKAKKKLRIANNNPWEGEAIDVNSRIDAQHREIWNFTNKWVRWSLLLIASLASLWTLMNPSFLKDWNSVFFDNYHTILFFYPFLPMLVHISAVVNPTNSRRRNTEMCDNIENYSSEKGYERVLILVGEMHREGIATQLRNNGWKIESNPTHSRIGKVVSRIYKSLGDWG